MEVRSHRSNDERSVSAWDNNGERLGFASRERRPEGIRYGIGIDNMGDPYRGVLDRELKTALGTIDYGYDGDTVAAGFTPNNPYAGLLQRLVGPQQDQVQGNPYYIQALANLLSRQR